MSNRTVWIAAISTSIVFYAALIAEAIYFRPARVNPCTADASQCYSIQGLYSKRDCPGQHAWFVESEGKEFFMGCRT
jgi:hypothetical protein